MCERVRDLIIGYLAGAVVSRSVYWKSCPHQLHQHLDIQIQDIQIQADEYVRHAISEGNAVLVKQAIEAAGKVHWKNAKLKQQADDIIRAEENVGRAISEGNAELITHAIEAARVTFWKNAKMEQQAAGIIQAAASPNVVVAHQADGFATVRLMSSAGGALVVAQVPNGELMTVLQEEGQDVKVRWNQNEGWARVSNLKPHLPTISELRTEARFRISTEKLSDLRRQALRLGATEKEVDNAVEQPDLRQSLLALIRSSQAEAADIRPDDTIQWMWGDTGMRARGHSHARLNPLCWSRWDQIGATIIDLEKLKDANRPVELRTKRAMATLFFDTIDTALLALRVHGHQYKTCIAMQADGHPEVVLRERPTQGRVVAKVANGGRLHIIDSEGDSVKVRWRTLDGWAKACNVREHLAESLEDPPLVQEARSMMQTCMQDIPELGAPRFTEPETIWEILELETQPVKLLRGTWVTKYAKDQGQKKGFPRRQELERTLATEAFLPRVGVECKEVGEEKIVGMCMNVVSVSYCWRALKHPDANGYQLRVVSSELERLLRSPAFRRYFNDAAIFWDFGSLHQKDERTDRRTSEEQKAFDIALNDMGIWYLHALVMTYIVNVSIPNEPNVNYESRGWTLFERSCAELLKPAFAGGGTQGDQWPMIIEFQSTRRSLPLSPELFARHMAHRRFTSRGDARKVVQLYTRTCVEALRGLRKMDLEYVKLHRHDGKQLASVLRHCCILEELWLQSMDINDTEVRDIAGVMPSMPALKKLILSENKIGNAGARAIAKTLPSMPLLEYLDLKHNKVGDDGSTAIADALLRMSSIKRIFLGENKIGDVGADAIANVLPGMPSLLALYMDENQIGDAGATAIAKVLPDMLSFLALDLDENEIGDVGATAIAKVLPSMPRLHELWLRRNKIDDAGAAAIGDALQSMQPHTTTRILLHGNPIKAAGKTSLENGKQKCRDTVRILL